MAMADNDLICNFKKCRKRLVDIAWVTSCSHTFCDEDGTREFSKSFVCPACDHNLNGKHDIVRQDLQPTEQWKSMILAALKPEIIMEVCSRAISYWTYQAHQEKIFSEYALKKSKESRDKLEQYYEQIVSKLHGELKSAKSDIQAKEKELNTTKKRYNELTEQHHEKTRQHQKLQIMYDTLRRKSINPANLEETSTSKRDKPANQEQFKSSHQFQMALGSNILGSSRCIPASIRTNPHLFQEKHPRSNCASHPPANTSESNFVLKPYPTPVQTALDQHEPNTSFRLQITTPRK